MAKFTLLPIIQSIRGKFGNLTFCYYRGKPIVKKTMRKMKNPKPETQALVRRIFSEVAKKWVNLSLIQKAEWDEYAKKFKRNKYTLSYGGIIPGAKGTVVQGKSVFIGVNSKLILSGLQPLEKPVFSATKPLHPVTNLKSYTQYKNGKIKFKIWLPHSPREKCVAQIWIKLLKKGAYSYLTKIVPLSSEPKEVMIEKIRTSQGTEIEFEKLEKAEVKLQMRTVSQNGESSASSALYKLEVYATSI